MGTIEHVSPFHDEADGDLYSLILLLRAPRKDLAAQVEQALRSILPGLVQPLPDESDLQEGLFQKHITSGRYYLDSHPKRVTLLGHTGATAIELRDEPWPLDAEELAFEGLEQDDPALGSLRRTIEAHRAALAVAPAVDEAVHTPTETNALHCRLAAALWGDDVIAVLERESMLLYPGISETRDLLATGSLAGDPTDPVQYACEHCVEAAAEQARACWSEFTDTFARRRRGHLFFVKHRLGPAGEGELVWSRVVGITGGKINARLESRPRDPDLATRGDPQRMPAGAVLDWYYELPDLDETGGWYSHPEQLEESEHEEGA